MPATRVLVTGASGFLGGFLCAELRRCAEVVTVSRSGGDFAVDLGCAQATAAMLAATAIDSVVYLAASSRLAECERAPDVARAINTLAPAELARRFGRRLLYVSTDMVFDGRRAPYAPLDPPAPLSVYGQTKAEGEERVLAAGGRVVRLPLLFGPDPQGRGASAMVRAALDRDRPLALFTNEYRTPLHAADAARALSAMARDPAGPRLSHRTGPERVSRWEFGRRLCDVLGLPRGLLQPAECNDALRPRDVSLHGDAPPRTLAEMLLDS